MKFEDLTPEQQAEAKSCKSPAEMLSLAKKLGYPLSDDELDAVAGGDGEWGDMADCGIDSHGFTCDGWTCSDMWCTRFTCPDYNGKKSNFYCDSYKS